jgi:hypothetical protein
MNFARETRNEKWQGITVEDERNLDEVVNALRESYERQK